MKKFDLSIATKKDKLQLLKYFKHYKVKEVIIRRVNSYIDNNYTIVAKDKSKIVGVLQWHIKENPLTGLAEFEEIHVLEEYRRQGIGSLLIQSGIESVLKYFNKNRIKPKRIFLFVSEDNAIARKLYEENNFKLYSNVGNLFSDNSKELIYLLHL